MAQQYNNPIHLSEEAICPICNQTIYWTMHRFPKTLLKHHQLNDKSCIREQKLNQLLEK
jgi:hypothetical protein